MVSEERDEEKQKEQRGLSWKDAIAFFIAALESLFLPLVILAIMLFIIAILLFVFFPGR